MEVAVVKHDTALDSIRRLADLEVVVEDESQLWIVLEVALHLNDAVDGGVDHHAVRVEQDSQLLEDVDENLV